MILHGTDLLMQLLGGRIQLILAISIAILLKMLEDAHSLGIVSEMSEGDGQPILQLNE
jgi:hypothetical protein